MARFGAHCAVLVEQDGEVILHKGYGIADRDTGVPITAETRFEIGSLGKQFTAAAILELQRLGVLSVADRIGVHLDRVPPDKAEITIHHLLAHRAGLPYQPTPGNLLDTALQFPPGERYSYSNVGYMILGQIVSRAAGTTFEVFLRDHLFAPAGVPGIRFTGTPMPGAELARGYVDGTRGNRPDQMTVSSSRGAGGFTCTTGELYRWIKAIHDGPVLDADARARLFSPPRSTFAYGWQVLPTTRDTELIRHLGNYGGFNAELRYYPEERRAIVFLSNHFLGGRSMYDAIVNRLALLLTGQEVPRPPAAVALEDSQLQTRSGTYRLDGGGAIHVTPDAGGLSLSTDDQRALTAMFVADPDQQTETTIASCSRWSLSVIDAMRRDARGEAGALFSPSWPQPGSYNLVRAGLSGIDQRLGGIQAVSVIGTIPTGGEGSGISTVELRGASSRQRVELTWRNGGLLNFQRVDTLPRRRFLPSATDRFAGFDIFSGTTVECRIAANPGDAASLVIGSGEDSILAHRVSHDLLAGALCVRRAAQLRHPRHGHPEAHTVHRSAGATRNSFKTM
jgi:CubicO group peptidase (beta-lactamase class C family)